MEELKEILEEEGGRVAKSMRRRVINAILDNQDIPTIRRHILKEEILPWIGDKLREMADRAIFEIFYPDKSYRPDRRRSRDEDYTSYSKSNRRTKPSTTRREGLLTRKSSSSDPNDDIASDIGPFNTDEVRFKSRDEAHDMRDAMIAAWKKDPDSGGFSVGAVYAVWGVTTTNTATSDFGWTDINDFYKARAFKGVDGYWHLDLPKPIEFED